MPTTSTPATLAPLYRHPVLPNVPPEIAAQLRLEREMVSSTVGKSLDSWFRESESTGKVGKSTRALENPFIARKLRAWLPQLAEAISSATISKNAHHYVLRKLAPIIPAYVALQAPFILNGEKSTTATFLAKRLGASIEREVVIAEDDELRTKIIKKTKNADGYRRSRIIERLMIKHPGVTPWTNKKRIVVGMFLLVILEDTLGLVEMRNRVTGKGTKVQRMVYTNNTMLAELDSLVEKMSLDSLFLWPMIVQPSAWEDVDSGGYLSPEGRYRNTLVKRKDAAELSAMYEGTDLRPTFTALNALQNTAWRVHTDVLGVICAAEELGLSLPKVGPQEALTAPTAVRPTPPDGNLEDETFKAEMQAYSRSWGVYMSGITTQRSQTVLAQSVIDIATRFEKYPRIYFPHNLDWRGRLYPLPTGLSPQGNDMSLGLLTFSTSEPLGDTGVYWLAVHGANVFGEDKLAMDARFMWTIDNTDSISAVADDPIVNRGLWVHADKPYQFLAFCLEWKKVLDGATTSSLPVRMDATCSGLQHLSAIARDPSTASSVNLTDGDLPADVYKDVAVDLVDKLKVMSDDDMDDMVSRWCSYGIDRKTTKRTVMVMPYGARMASGKQHIIDDMDDKFSKGVANPFEGVEEGTDGKYLAAMWLSKHLWSSINETIPGARNTMDWLQDKARRMAKEDLPMEWTTPDGLKIRQEYRTFPVEEVSVVTMGRRLTINVGQEELKASELNRRKQSSGMAPNFVHSLDACALRMYVNAAKAEGITSHAVVHDSFGVHAGRVQTMQVLIRSTFVDMYTGFDVLAPIREQMKENDVDPGEPMEDLGFDLEQVRKSTYFFS